MKSIAWIDRKEIARLLNLSYDWVRYNEDRIGLGVCRTKFSGNVLRFRRRRAIAILRKKGLLVIDR